MSTSTVASLADPARSRAVAALHLDMEHDLEAIEVHVDEFLAGATSRTRDGQLIWLTDALGAVQRIEHALEAMAALGAPDHAGPGR